jgi:hypothetical protein
MSDELLPLNHIARRLRVPVRWLKIEAQAGRVPALDAGGVLLANPDAVRAALLVRAIPQNAEIPQEVAHAAH